MVAQLRRWGAVVALALWASTARAQGAAPDSSAEIIAGMVHAVEFAVQRCGTADIPQAEQAAFESNRSRFEASLSRSLALVRATGGTDSRPGVLVVARARDQARDIFGADLGDETSNVSSLRFLLEMHESFFDERLSARLPADSLRAFEAKLDKFRHVDLEAAQKRALGRIHHYEIKYGPGSAQLNFVEAVLNLGAQRLAPFKPGANGVSPLELVAGYSTTYVTTVEGDATAISAAEFGLRVYNWGYHDLPTTVAQAAVPRFWTIALAVAARDDGALEWPWSKQPRLGPALGWGEFKVAYLFGEGNDWRLVVTRQMMLLPHMF